MQQKEYLTKELIAYLERQARDPIWSMGLQMSLLGSHIWYNLLSVSGLGLIHFNGNQDTGWQHISFRHQFYSTKNYFGKGANGNPSKFTSQSIPIEDYVKIADDVYREGNIENKEHPEEKLFVKYVGKSSRYIGSEGIKKEFVLILYRNTKIVHSIYPKKNLEGKGPKRILEHLARLKNNIGLSFHITSGKMTVKIPYANENGLVRYEAIMEIDSFAKKGEGFLQVYLPSGDPFFKTNKLLEFSTDVNLIELITDRIKMTRFLNFWSVEELSHMENIILEIEKSEFF